MQYLINEQTLCLLPYKGNTQVIEMKHRFTIKRSPSSIVDICCCHYGSNLEGRQKGSSYLLGTSYKTPIIIDETKKIILIPTHSIRNNSCSWFLLNNILNYYEIEKNQTEIVFINGKKITISYSYSKFDKQVIRATRLESILNGRNNKKHL